MKERIASIDIVRGLIMIIMTLDHTRDFLMLPGSSPVNMQTTTVILFFTRWITHFCAPTFVFLGGVSAFLAGQKRTSKELSLFLLRRGLWLILSDVVIISLLFTFNPHYPILVLEVLWASGCGMILLALLLRAPLSVITGLSLLILFGHNLLDPVQQLPALVNILLKGAGTQVQIGGGRVLMELYAVLPWSAVLLLGYSFGTLFKTGADASRRRKILTWSGIGMVLLFVVLRLVNLYGDPSPWSTQRNMAHTTLSFLNTTKQPPSLLFFAMTLGPVLILLAQAERISGRFADICLVYGKVPYIYFIGHLFFLRLLNLSLIPLQGLSYHPVNFPLVWQAVGFGFPLWAVYLFWLLVLATLYLPCKWYGTYKRTHQHWWLSYL